MLQGSGRCAHIWDPNRVYIETGPIHLRRGLESIVDTLKLNPYICVVFACMGSVLMYLQLILTPYANEWV